MDRRGLLAALGATATGLSAVGAAHARQGEDRDIHQRCADACFDCEKQCSYSFHHCLKQLVAGRPGYDKAARLCVDCAEVCSTAGKLVARTSPLMAHTCRACAECCEACIAACETLEVANIKDVIASLARLRRELPRDGQGDGRQVKTRPAASPRVPGARGRPGRPPMPITWTHRRLEDR